MLPTRAVLGRRTTAVLLKRRLGKTDHPYNRLFLMFEDGAGMEFFFHSLLLPHSHMDADRFDQIAKERRQSPNIRSGGRLRLPPDQRKRRQAIRPFVVEARTNKNDQGKEEAIDKSIIRTILGRRIDAIHQFFETGRFRPMRYIDLVFSDGTAFEFVTFGFPYVCDQPQAFDLSSLLRRGHSAYENELLAIMDPDSGRIALPINRLHRSSDIE